MTQTNPALPDILAYQITGIIDGACMPFGESFLAAISIAAVQNAAIRVSFAQFSQPTISFESLKEYIATVTNILNFMQVKEALMKSDSLHECMVRSKQQIASDIDIALLEGLKYPSWTEFQMDIKQAHALVCDINEGVEKLSHQVRRLMQLLFIGFVQFHPVMAERRAAACSHN